MKMCALCKMNKITYVRFRYTVHVDTCMHACMISNVGLAVWLLEVCFCHFAFVVSQCGCLNLKSAQCTDPYFYVTDLHFTNISLLLLYSTGTILF